ncbi:MAG: DUF1615 domain-containing protein [Pseudomonadota bacterium]|nr:DUF1615 domain-containing protein [Pseudomonadota bacterium]
MKRARWSGRRAAAGIALLALLGGCATPSRFQDPPRRPADVRAEIVRLLPPETADRDGWATDVHAAFAALDIEPTTNNLCSALAVTQQESTFNHDPAVPGLAKIARGEIDRRAEQMHVPQLLVSGALRLRSSDGSSFGERLEEVRTEHDLSRIYEEFIGMVPLGQRLLAGSNPVRTGGPMQVSIDFAQQHAQERPYPYPTAGSIRDEVFTRRGGMYFGIAHLLGYPASYDQPLYRFADFNAGWYASRNAAFQSAVTLASGIPLELDGDLIRHAARRGDAAPGATELAVGSLSRELQMDPAQIRRDLERSDRLEFESTVLHQRLFDVAERIEGRSLPRAVMPRIRLSSPKITRELTTEWFAKRVDERHRRCMKRGGR